MHYEQKRKILNEYKSINHEIWRLELELEGWETIATSIPEKGPHAAISNTAKSASGGKMDILFTDTS